MRQYPQVHLGVGAASFGNVCVGVYGLWYDRADFSEIACDLGLVISNDGVRFREPGAAPGQVYIHRDDSPATPAPGRNFHTILCQGNGILNVGDETRIYSLELATAYLRCEGGKVQRDLFSYSLEWPDGSRMERVSFQSRDAQDNGLQHVSLEDARIRRLVQQLPRVVATESIPCVRIASLPAEVVGYWSLWRIALDNQSLRDVKIIPIFHHDDGRNLVPTARHIWDTLMEDRPEVELVGTKTGAEVEAVFGRLRSEAERQGEDGFHELYARHQQRLKREQEKGNYAFQVRREALHRIGLPEVRQHRLKRLDEEERAWAAELRKREQILPELQPVILLRVEAGNG